MTREEKISKKKARKAKRVQKRKDKDNHNMNLASSRKWDCTRSEARKIVNGTLWTCEVGYGACESRGYCNGDC